MTHWMGKAGTQMAPMNWLESHSTKRFILRSNSYQPILEAANREQGIALIAEPSERNLPGVVRLDVDAELAQVPIYLVYHRSFTKCRGCVLVAHRLTAELGVQIR